MINPDFGESQLQQLFNAELITKLPAAGIQPIVPKPHEEQYLGWDTGFYISGLKPPDQNQKNCNLFLQYKLSVVIEGPRGNEWNYWRQPYFRFDIPHWKSPGYGRHQYPDFHQYDALKNLAANGFPTFYVTNHTVDLDELLRWANNKVIVDSNPALDIHEINGRHLVATFTEESDYYLLATEPEKATTVSLDSMKGIILKARRTSLKEDIDIIPRLLVEHEVFTKLYQLEKKERKIDTIESEWLLLHHIIFRVLGLNWWKLSV